MKTYTIQGVKVKTYTVQCVESQEYHFQGEWLLREKGEYIFRNADGCEYHFVRKNVICVSVTKDKP